MTANEIADKDLQTKPVDTKGHIGNSEVAPLNRSHSTPMMKIPNVPLSKHTVEAEKSMPSNVNISMKDFLQQNDMEIFECGGGGDCLIYSIIRQVLCYNMTDEEFDECKKDIMAAFREGLTMKVQEAHQAEIRSNINEQLNGLSKDLGEINKILKKNDNENKKFIGNARNAINELSDLINKEGITENTEKKFQELSSQIENICDESNLTLEYFDELLNLTQDGTTIFSRIRGHITVMMNERVNSESDEDFNTLLKEVSTRGTYLDLGKSNLAQGILQLLKEQLEKDMQILVCQSNPIGNTHAVEISPQANPKQLTFQQFSEEAPDKFQHKENYIFLYYIPWFEGASGHYQAIGKFPEE